MAQRIASSMALLVFAVCLLAGMQADNPFGTTLWRALKAMGATLVVGLVVGLMAQKMMNENLSVRKNAAIPEAKQDAPDR